MNSNRLNKTVFFILLISFIFTTSSFAEEPAALTLDSLIKEALENNPKTKSALNRWRAAKYNVKDVSALPDPMARYTYFGQSVETRVGPQEHKYGVSQTVPFPLKLYYKGKSATKEADMLKEEYEAAKREVIKEVKFIYYDIFWLDKALGILEKEKAILENLEKVARVEFEANRAPQQDPIKAGVEISKIIDRTLMVKQQRRAKRAMMNNLLSRPSAMALDRVKDIEIEEFNYDLLQLHDLASESRQELIEANLNIERAKYERSLSQLNFVPDFTFGFDYISVGSGTSTRSNDGKDAWMTTFAVNVPIWVDKQYAQIKEKENMLKAAEYNYEDVENTVAYEIEDVYFKVATYKDIVSLYETALVPQTEQAFDAARTGYETGKVDFLNWLDSERVLLQTKLAYYKAMVDYEKSIAYLERVVGRDL